MYSENYQLLKIYACTLGTRTKTTLNLKCRPLGMKKKLFWNSVTTKGLAMIFQSLNLPDCFYHPAGYCMVQIFYLLA